MVADLSYRLGASIRGTGKRRSKGRSTLIKHVADEWAKPQVCDFRAGKRDLALQCINCHATFRPV